MPLVPHVTPGAVISSSWGNLVADHVVMRFTTAAQRTSQLPAPIAGQLTQLDTTPTVVEVWSGTAWVPTVPPRQLAYVEFTAQKVVTQTNETTADLVVAGPALTYDGTTPVIVEAYLPAVVTATAAGVDVMIWLYQDAASIGRLATLASSASTQLISPVHAARRLTPTAGSHTYSIGATAHGGAGSVFGGPGGVGQYVPGYIRIERAT